MEQSALAVEWVKPDRLFLNPANPRKNDEAVPHVAASLRRFGWQQPIVAKPSGEVIAGNTRLKAALELRLAEVPVVRFPGTELEATAYSIADNRTHEFATWDTPALAELLKELQAEDALEGVGYSGADINELLDQVQSLIGPTEVEDAPADAPKLDAVSRSGDLWILGRHRLLCGDSSDTGEVDRLLAGKPIHLVNMDPPYNVRVEPRSNNAIAAGLSSFTNTHHQKLDLARHPSKAKPTSELRAKDRPLQNDFIPDDEFARLLRAWFGNAARALRPGRGFYIWGGYANCANYPAALAECGLYFSQSIIWVKEHAVLTRKDFMGNHEWCFYGWKEGAAHQFLGPNNATDVWSVKKLNHTAMVHLTEKPVELAVRAIQYSSRKGENVLDLFGGSGSTLIACEQMDRTAFLAEIDGPYSDVIIKRWQKFTRTPALLEGTGESFEAMAVERGVVP